MNLNIISTFLLLLVFLIKPNISYAKSAKDSVVFYNYTLFCKTKKNKEQDLKLLEGYYSLFVNGKTYRMQIKVHCNKPKAKIKFKKNYTPVKFTFKNNIVMISSKKSDIFLKLIGKIVNKAGAMQGVAYDNNGNKGVWTAAKLILDKKLIKKL